MFDSFDYNATNVDHVALDQKIREYNDLKLVFFILPSKQLRCYAEIKNYTTLRLGGTKYSLFFKQKLTGSCVDCKFLVAVPSQCFLGSNLVNKNLNSIATKVIIQMVAKMGGVPWSVKIPFKVCMAYQD